MVNNIEQLHHSGQQTSPSPDLHLSPSSGQKVTKRNTLVSSVSHQRYECEPVIEDRRGFFALIRKNCSGPTATRQLRLPLVTLDIVNNSFKLYSVFFISEAQSTLHLPMTPEHHAT